MTWEEFFKEHPEYIPKKKTKKKVFEFLCQCKNGHTFDYRERIKYPKDNPHYAPCQGRCPICGCGTFTHVGSGVSVYPIKMNFTG